MIGLDTNILVRYFAQDDEAQAKKASEVIEKRLTVDDPGFICSVVLVELCGTLTRLYRVKPDRLAMVLERLFRIAEFSIEHREEAWKALQMMRQTKADFADAYIGQIHQRYGCEVTLTFDKTAGKTDSFDTL